LGTYVKEKIEKNEKKVPNLAILRGTKKIFWRKKRKRRGKDILMLDRKKYY